MLVYKLTCPVCEANLKSAKSVLAEKRIRCPQCHARFPAALAEVTEPAPQQATARAYRPRDRVEELLHDIRRDSHRDGSPEPEPLQPNQSNPTRRAALIAGAAIVLLVGAGVALSLATSGTRQLNPAPAQPVAKAQAPARQVEPVPDSKPDAGAKASPPTTRRPGDEGNASRLDGASPLVQDLAD